MSTSTKPTKQVKKPFDYDTALRLMRRELRSNGFLFEWGFYAFDVPINPTPSQVKVLFDEWNALLMARGRVIANAHAHADFTAHAQGLQIELQFVSTERHKEITNKLMIWDGLIALTARQLVLL